MTNNLFYTECPSVCYAEGECLCSAEDIEAREDVYLELTGQWARTVESDDLVKIYDNNIRTDEHLSMELDDLHRKIEGIKRHLEHITYDNNLILGVLDKRGDTTMQDRYEYAMECYAESQIGRSSSDW